MAWKVDGHIAAGHLACAKEAHRVGIDDRFEENTQIIKTSLRKLRGIVLEPVRCLPGLPGTGLKADGLFRLTVLEGKGEQAIHEISRILGNREPGGRLFDMITEEKTAGS